MKQLLNENTKMQFSCYKLANFSSTFVTVKGNGFPSVHCDKFIVKLVLFRQCGAQGGTWQSHKLLHLFIVSSDLLALVIRSGNTNKKQQIKISGPHLNFENERISGADHRVKITSAFSSTISYLKYFLYSWSAECL